MVLREGRLQVGRVAEHDQPDPIVLAPIDEAVEDLLHGVEPGDALSGLALEVLVFHRTGEIDDEHEVACGDPLHERILDDLGARGGQDEEHPDADGDAHLQTPAAEGDGALLRRTSRRRFDARHERPADRRLASRSDVEQAQDE